MTQEPCPEQYQSHVESEVLCELWEELQSLQEDGVLSTTVTPLPTIDCLYSNHSDGADLLCELFCKVQLYKGLQCNPLCPEVYRNNSANHQLCQLWSELQELEDNDSMNQLTTLNPVECPHENNLSGNLTCSLWCQIITYKGSQCISCPQSYRNDSESELLCSLWTELQMTNHDIDTGKLTMPTSFQNMTCKYSNHPTSSENLCTVWCELQLGRGSKSDLYCRLFCLIHSFILFLEPVLSLFTLTPSITEGFPVCILS